MTDTSEIVKRVTEYLSEGGLFNPELMEHDKVRDMVIECRDRLEALAAENKRLREALAIYGNPESWATDNGLHLYGPDVDLATLNWTWDAIEEAKVPWHIARAALRGET